MSACQIDNGQPTKTESQRTFHVIAVIIRPAMRNTPRHPFKVVAKHRIATSEVILSADSAHRISSSVLPIGVRLSQRFYSETERSSGYGIIAIGPSGASGTLSQPIKSWRLRKEPSDFCHPSIVTVRDKI